MTIRWPSFESLATVVGAILIVAGQFWEGYKYHTSAEGAANALAFTVLIGGIYFFLKGIIGNVAMNLDAVGKIGKQIDTESNIREQQFLHLKDSVVGIGGFTTLFNDLYRLKSEKITNVGIRSSGRVLEDVVSIYARELARSLLDWDEGSLTSVKIDDISPVEIFLDKFVECLPNGSFWLGVSRLQGRDAWHGSDGATMAWNERLLDRVSHGAIKVFRVWVFDTVENCENMTEEMKRQAQQGVAVRQMLARSGSEESAHARDITYVFVPTESDAQKVPQIEGDPFQALESSGYQLLQALEFTIRGYDKLKSVDILTSRDAQQGRGDFRYCWRNSKSMTFQDKSD